MRYMRSSPIISIFTTATPAAQVYLRVESGSDANLGIRAGYGVTIAYSLGIFERALRPFPSALEAATAVRSSEFRVPS